MTEQLYLIVFIDKWGARREVTGYAESEEEARKLAEEQINFKEYLHARPKFRKYAWRDK